MASSSVHDEDVDAIFPDDPADHAGCSVPASSFSETFFRFVSFSPKPSGLFVLCSHLLSFDNAIQLLGIIFRR
jgi:hypothetical protein